MSEYRINDFTVRTTDKGEIEITQSHLEQNDQPGIFIAPEQVELFIKHLEWAVRDLRESLDTN